MELQHAGFLTTTDAVGWASMVAYSYVFFFHRWRAATRQAMSGWMNSTRQML